MIYALATLIILKIIQVSKLYTLLKFIDMMHKTAMKSSTIYKNHEDRFL